MLAVPADHVLLPLSLETSGWPAALGAHKVQAVGWMNAWLKAPGDASPRPDLTATLVDVELLLEQVQPPAVARKIKALASLPVVCASITPKDSRPTTHLNPYTHELGHGVVVCPASTQLLVPEQGLLQTLWTHYQVNLHSVQAALKAVRHQHYQDGPDLEQHGRGLARRAFGHPEDTDLGDSPPEGRNAQNDLVAGQALHSEGDVARYFSFRDCYYLVAFLELVRAKDIALDLPSADCLIHFPSPTEERAVVRLLDTWKDAADGLDLPLEARKEYGTTGDQVRELFRLRAQIAATREERRTLQDRTFSQLLNNQEGRAPAPAAVLGMLQDRGYTVHRSEVQQTPPQDELLDRVRALFDAEYELQARLWPLYAELTRWAAKHKERLHKVTREREAVSFRVVTSKQATEALVPLPSNLGKLPAHFAAIPAGLETTLHAETDQYGRAILRVRRQSLDLGGGPAPQEQLPFNLPLGESGHEQGQLLAQAELLLGPNGPRWLIPQGIVAISKLYENLGGYSGAKSIVRIYENSWVDTMRPGQVPRFKQKGRGAAFGHGNHPRDLFNALLGVLSRLTYDSQTKTKLTGWSELSGFYLITASGEDARGRWSEIMLNPSLHKFISGDGGLPYMVTNTKAMFEYPKEALDYCPSAQMALEQLARINLYRRSSATISDPHGGGLTRLEFANRWGLLRGPNEDSLDVLRRFNRTLDSLGKAGVIADARVDGLDKGGRDAFGVKLLITMHDDYRRAYDLGRDQEKLRGLDQQLAAPFAEPKKIKAASAAGPVAKKRGRPRKV